MTPEKNNLPSGNIISRTGSKPIGKLSNGMVSQNEPVVKKTVGRFSCLENIGQQNRPSALTSDGFGENGFDYRIAYFRDLDGRYYKLTFSVGVNNDGKVAYNIGNIEEIPFPDESVTGSKAQKEKVSPNKKKTQNEPVVKNDFGKTSMQYAYEQALATKQGDGSPVLRI